MNLFCFTLEGSTESMYEPANNQKLKEVLPKYHCSPVLLRRNADWGGSDPSITSKQPQGKIKLKSDSKRSCVPTSVLDKEILEKDIHHTCWISCGDKKNLFHQTKVQKEEMREAVTTTEDRARDRTRADLPAQDTDTTADTPESIKNTGRLRKLQNLVQAKSGSGKGKSTSKSTAAADVVSSNNSVLTCMGCRRRTERRFSKTASLPQQLMQQQVRDLHKDPEEDATWNPSNYLWSPFDYPLIHASVYQNCHEPRHQLCGLRQTTDWDRFETLARELDRKHSSLSPPQMIHSITDLHLYQNTLTRFERFDALRQHSPSMRPQDNGSCPQTWEQNGEPTDSRLQRTEMESPSRSDRRHIEEETPTLICNRDVQKGEAEKREADRGRPITKARSGSSNSLESLYSLNSGQSSSSGVTSGSDCSSNRNSLRLDDDLLCTGQFCGRARVHTEYVPSPYDTESLKLKVGDVIDIITKSPMGIWTGMLNGRVGNFKFIYVDVLRKEASGAPQLERRPRRARHKSTVQEVLKRLSLEEYSTCLQLGGFQTVDDLMRLRENHLTEMHVTDREHRQRLLAAVSSLQQLRSDCQLGNEADREAGNATENRDSGCPMPSDSPDSITEDADLPLLSDHRLPADAAASREPQNSENRVLFSLQP